MTEPDDFYRTDKKPSSPFGNRNDIPLRAKSVSLNERPRSKYIRAFHSAESIRSRFHDKQYVHGQPSTTDVTNKRYAKTAIKYRIKRVVEKIPLAIPVQTLSIPMKYADNPKPRHSTSKPSQYICDSKQIDSNKSKNCNPRKQVGDNKRLCQTIGCGKETQNRLLVQIREAEQVSDFERILNTNAILCDRAKKQVWRGYNATYKHSASVVSRPRSAYSLYAVSQAYHYLFHQHEESLQPLIYEYRRTIFDKQNALSPTSLLGNSRCENLQDLSEFYDDDNVLRKEIETITDSIIAEEVKASKEIQGPDKRNNNFNVNLTDLIGLHVNGDSCSNNRDDSGPSPEVEKREEDEKGWLTPIMNANIDNQFNSENEDKVTCITRNLDSVKIDDENNLPSITFSNFCDGFNRNDLPKNTNVIINLTVPTADVIEESRPPMP